MVISCFFGLLFSLFTTHLLADECKLWFKEQGLEKGKKCLIKCSMAEVDMDTFYCPNKCSELCNLPKKEQFFLVLSNAYPGLTIQEKALASKYPLKMLDAYKLSWKAETLCLDIFPASQSNDASDACRHFVWSALLYKEYGDDLSTKILNAHEENPKQLKTEKSMDLANNRLGQSVAKQLVEKNKLTEKEIMKSFKNHWKEGNLVILEKTKGGGKNEKSHCCHSHFNDHSLFLYFRQTFLAWRIDESSQSM